MIFLLFQLFVGNSFAGEQMLPEISVQEDQEDIHSLISPHEEIKIENKKQLKDLLELTPGIQVLQAGGLGGQTSISLRGSDPKHTLVTIEGLMLNDPSTIGRQFNAAILSTHFFEQANIFYGPQTILYGGEGLAGVVELKPHLSKNNSTFHLELGSFNSKSLYFDQSIQEQNSSLHWGAQWIKSDGFSRVNQKRFKANEKDGFESVQGQSFGEYRFNTSLSLAILARGTYAETDQDQNFSDSKDSSIERALILAPFLTYRLDKKNKLQAYTSYQPSRREYFYENFNQNYFQSYVHDSRLGYNHQNNQFDLQLGLHSFNESYQDNNIKKMIKSFSQYGLVRKNINNLNLMAGLRNTYHELFGNWGTYQTGLEWVNQKSTFFFNHSRGIKSPSLYELYAPDFLGDPIGNINLRPEKLTYYETGLRGSFSNVDYQINLFQQEFNDLIQYSLSSGYENINALNLRGMTTNSKIKLSPDHHLLLTSFHQTALSQKLPYRRAAQEYSLQLISQLKNSWEIFYEYKWVGKRQDQDELKKDIDLFSYEIMNMGLKKVIANHQYSIKIHNLLNRHYEEIYGQSITPWGLNLGYQLTYD